jgi:hypothetical protein
MIKQAHGPIMTASEFSIRPLPILFLPQQLRQLCFAYHHRPFTPSFLFHYMHSYALFLGHLHLRLHDQLSQFSIRPPSTIRSPSRLLIPNPSMSPTWYVRRSGRVYAFCTSHVRSRRSRRILSCSYACIAMVSRRSVPLLFPPRRAKTSALMHSRRFWEALARAKGEQWRLIKAHGAF